jgi:hypothetical protein
VVRIDGSLLGEQFLCMSLRTPGVLRGWQLTVVAKMAMSTTIIFEHTRITNAPCVAYLEVVLLADRSRDDIGSECNAMGRPYVKQ